MNKAWITLPTLDYPPNLGGVAEYLSSLVKEAGGEVEVVLAEKFFRKLWPRWWPLVGVCRREAMHGRLLLISHVFPLGTAAWLAHLFSGSKYAVLFHGKDVRLVQGWWRRWLLRRICHQAQALIAVSESTKRDLLSKVPGLAIQILTPAVTEEIYPLREEARARLGLSPNEQLIVSLARFVPRKGLDQALRAMGRLQQKRDITYAILGDGEDRERLEKIAMEEKVSPRWVIHPTDEEKKLWLAASDVFLLPVRDDKDDVEGFGIVFLEAAKAGVPAIAGRSGGAVEAVLDGVTGLVVDPHVVDEIAAAVTRLLDDEELRRRLGDAAKHRVEKDFCWRDRWVKLKEILL